MNMTEATQATNALNDTFKRGGVYINDSPFWRQTFTTEKIDNE